MTHLGTLIDQRLQELGWERQQLAKELDIVPVSVSRWLRTEGDTPVSWRYYQLLSGILRIPLEDILSAAKKDTPHYVATYERFFGGKVWRGKESARRRAI